MRTVGKNTDAVEFETDLNDALNAAEAWAKSHSDNPTFVAELDADKNRATELFLTRSFRPIVAKHFCIARLTTFINTIDQAVRA